jgi:hypothetical protein
MNQNIDVSNIPKYMHLNNDKTNNKTNDKTNNKTSQFVKYCFYSINEAEISDTIKNIPYYFNCYFIVESYDFLNINKLDDDFIEKLNISDDHQYLIFKYNNVNTVNYTDYLFDLDQPKLFILNIIESFSYLLKSLITLNSKNICFFNLSPENIVFNLDCGKKPFLQNFQLSLNIDNISESYITNIIEKTYDYTHKPIEVHLLFYLIKNDMNTISYSFIEEISDIFINNLHILNMFSAQFKESYKKSSIEFMKKYINKSKKEIILSILEYTDKFDVYSLSVLYLHIFGNISKIFNLKQTFINKISLELSKNIHPDPVKRSSLQKLFETFDKLFMNENDWSFAENIEVFKMRNLLNILDT